MNKAQTPTKTFTNFLLAAKRALCILALVLVIAPLSSLQAAPLSTYQKVSGVSGKISTIGSDTFNNMMTLWAESFKTIYPNVKIQIEGKGSSTAPPALIQSIAQIGPMSREMKPQELEAFEKKFGYKPTKIAVAIDALAIFVHKDNPVKSFNLEQLDSIFSSSYKRGGRSITRWGRLGLQSWLRHPISLYGRNSASGTYGYFKKSVLLKGDYSDSVKEQPGSSAVIQGVAADLYGIGYSGIGYFSSGVRVVPLGEAKTFYEPTQENCVNGNYPLARLLYIYINKAPGKPIDLLTREFISFMLSEEGQKITQKDGFFPLTPELIKQNLKKLH